MRLLNTKELRFESFPTPQTPEIPDYAILSHKWSDREVTLDEMQNHRDSIEETSGFAKVKQYCEQAANVGFSWVWIDTCCIDKTNNVELTEALNSMFHWYRQAQVCYAYLADVKSSRDDPRDQDSDFRRSRWFTRGWTLQELLAPQYVLFFDQNWSEIGTKSSLQELISEITGISSQVLLLNYGGEISVAQRMAWASRRKTAKIEDQAYCLMGLFGINMPMIYGEGENAFHRLQLEILKTSDDQSIFAWASDNASEKRELLARSPREFVNCGDVRRLGDDTETSPFSMTNKGLHIKLPLVPSLEFMDDEDGDIFLAVLNCQRKEEENMEDRPALGIYLQRTGPPRSNTFLRVKPNEIQELDGSVNFEDKSEIYIRGEDPSRFDVVEWMQPEPQYRFFIKKRPKGVPRVEENGKIIWKVSEGEIRLTFNNSGCSGLLVFKNPAGQMFVVILGVHNYNVWCDIATDYEDDTLKPIGKDYWEGRRQGARWNNLDRRTASLPSGDSIFLAIKKGQIAQQRAYLIEIAVSSADFCLVKVGPGCCYVDGW